MASSGPSVTPAETKVSPVVTLYWLEESRSQRILWLLEELNVPYELKIFHRDPVTHLAGPELKEIHPLGKSPVISVQEPGSEKPIVIAESAFIVEYLLDHFSNGSSLLPKRYQEGKENVLGGETEEWLRYRYYMHYAEGSLMTLLMIHLVVLQIKNAPIPFFLKPITAVIASKVNSSFLDRNFEAHFALLESQLKSSLIAGDDYLCGPRLTGADILMSFPLIGGLTKHPLYKKEAYPTLVAYIERLQKEPGYVKAVDKIISIEGKFDVTSF